MLDLQVCARSTEFLIIVAILIQEHGMFSQLFAFLFTSVMFHSEEYSLWHLLILFYYCQATTWKKLHFTLFIQSWKNITDFYIGFIFYNLTNLLIISHIFIDSQGFSLHKIKPSAYRDGSVFSFLIWTSHISSRCITVLATTSSNTVLLWIIIK